MLGRLLSRYGPSHSNVHIALHWCFLPINPLAASNLVPTLVHGGT